ncbi:hypothetical protein ABZS86_36245 [Streptomyces sp. NPDC005355]|uniref:hypothetical protein n=1 Tax=Streptomyces sp. NPDC005355 TaxID=3157038 RepID=UPI0033BA52E4
MRRTLIPVLLAALTLTACSSEPDKAEQYWHGYHFGEKTALAYAKRVVDDTFEYCTTGGEVAARQDVCTQPGGPDTRYPTHVGQKDCADELPDGLDREERDVWIEGCHAGMALDVPDTVTYGSDPAK